jgi:uroporphyrinogen-III synthase
MVPPIAKRVRMPDPVVITRPLAQATALEMRVAELGRTSVLFPLLDIQALPDQTPLRDALRVLDDYALVAFVSPNAIDAAFAVRADWPQGMAFAVVGEGSRLALERYGIASDNAKIYCPTDPDRTDSETLLQTLDLDALRGKRVLIVRGETGRELLGDVLRSAGIEVTTVAAYRRVAPVFDEMKRRELKRLLQGQNDWIVTSSEALRFLMDMVTQLDETGDVAKMQQQMLFVPHVRIAETARALGFTNITLTRSGDDGLIAALQSRT